MGEEELHIQQIHLKTKVYSTHLQSLQDLEQRIVHECNPITLEMLYNVREHFQQSTAT